MLIVDTREPKGLIAAVKARVDDVVVRALASADFVLLDCNGQSVGIERKTISDWLSSLAGPRMDNQVDRMDATYPVRILLLEGSFEVAPDGHLVIIGERGVRTSGWTHAAYQMALLSLQHRHGFYVLSTAGLDSTVDTLRVLHDHVATRAMQGRIPQRRSH